LVLATCGVAVFALACLIFTLTGAEESWKHVAMVAAMLLTGPLVFFVGKKVSPSSAERDVLPEWRSPK
jgi:hypothetical protein